MYLLYLDDSGSANNPNEDYLVLGGVSVFERAVYFISRELDEIAKQYNEENPYAVEFHASEIYRGKSPPWDGLRNRNARIEVIQKVLDVLARHRFGTYAYAVAVYKASYPNGDPMEIAFEELCSRFDLQLKNENASRDKKHHQRGMIVLDDSTYETTLQRLARDFRQVGTRWGVVKNLADVPLFVDSSASRLVQLADHVAYAVFRFYNAKDGTYIAPILKKFYADPGGKIHGLVHKQTYDLRCMCPACMSRRMA